MRKIFILAMMFLPCIMFGQTVDTTDVQKIKEKTADAIRQLPAAHQHLILILMENAKYDKDGSAYWVYSGDTIRSMEDVALRFMEDNKVTGICNVPFGSSYEKAKKILEEKYGDYDFLESTKDCITYRDKFYGGMHFSYMHFMFQSDGEYSYFHRAVLCENCKTKDEAVRLKQSIDEKLSKQYQLFKVLDEGNTYFSIGGISPAPGEGVFGGYALGVDILEYSKPTRNGCQFAVRIMYGPYEYVEETF